MQTFTEEAINLKAYRLKENDKIILMYSKSNGLVRAIAKGAQKAKSKLSGRMEMLVSNRLLMHKGRNLNIITQADSINSFLKIRQDIDKMIFGMYCAEIIMNFGVENDPSSEEIYNLFYNYLEQLSQTEGKTEILLSTLRFQLKIVQILGYNLELEKCANCITEIDSENIYFSLGGGGVVCKDCAEKYPHSKKMNVKLKNFLQTLLLTDFKEKTTFDKLANEKISQFCFNLLKDYISQFSPKPFKTISAFELQTTNYS